MNKAAYIVAFGCGAVFAAAVMTILKERKQDTVEEETDAVFLDDGENIDEEENHEVVTIPQDHVELTEVVSDICKKNGYSVGDRTNQDDNDGPYVIAPEEFGEYEDYDAINMTLTSDNVLLDDSNGKVEDPENNVGTGFMNYFGVYPDDPNTVYIRNDDLCADFEIVKDLRTFEEIDADLPHMKWRENG